MPLFCKHRRVSTFEREARNTAYLMKRAYQGFLCRRLRWKFIRGSLGGDGDRGHIDYSDGHLTRLTIDSLQRLRDDSVRLAVRYYQSTA